MGEEDRTARGAGRRYLEDSSMAGVRRAARPPAVTRVIWVVILVVCVAMTIYTLVRLVEVRTRRRQAVTSRMDETRSVTFPDVTVCDVRAVTLATVTGRGFVTDAGNASAWRQLVFTYLTGQSLNSQSETENRALRHEYQTLVDHLTSEQRADAGFQLSKMLLDCTLGDAPCDESNFTRFYHHKYGNCYTFSPQPAYQDIWLSGVQPGLRLELRANLEDDAQEEAGFIIGIHESRDTLLLPEEGVFVPGGMVSYIALTKATRVAHADCEEDREDNGTNLYAANTGWGYSHRGCRHGCLQQELYDRCACCDLDLPCPSAFLDPSSSSSSDDVAARRCSTEDEMTCRSDVLQEYTDGSLPCLSDCLPRCRQSTYSRRVSTSTLLLLQAPVIREIPPNALTVSRTDSQAEALQKDLGLQQPAQDTQESGSAALDLAAVSSGDGPLMTDAITSGDGPAVTEPFTTEPPTSETPPPVAAVRRKRQYNNGPQSAWEVARIHVYFEDLRSPITDIEDETDWSEWLAAVGGVLSLWLGLSILGLLEVFHLLLDLAFLVCCAPFRPQPTLVKPMTP